jgi:SAM-dependent methyltransferase
VAELASRSDVSRYYDRLDLWTRLNKGFRAFSGIEAHAVHRWLVHPETGLFGPSTIHDIMMSSGVGKERPIAALDAGCGYGGTVFALHAALGGRWHGVTVSRRQYAVARKLLRRRDLGDAVSFALASYDAPLGEGFNLIYGIESLIHSTDPRRTVANLSGALAPGGRFVIVDDMPVDDVPPAFAGDLADFKTLWRAPVMPSAAQWIAHLEAAGCEITESRDLSALMRPRSQEDISRALVEVDGRRRWRDRLGLRRVGEAETGGLLLERLGRAGVVRYMMISARRRN